MLGLHTTLKIAFLSKDTPKYNWTFKSKFKNQINLQSVLHCAIQTAKTQQPSLLILSRFWFISHSCKLFIKNLKIYCYMEESKSIHTLYSIANTTLLSASLYPHCGRWAVFNTFSYSTHDRQRYKMRHFKSDKSDF